MHTQTYTSTGTGACANTTVQVLIQTHKHGCMVTCIGTHTNTLVFTTLKKEIKEDANKWKHVLCSCIGRINIIKMSIVPKAICRFNAILSKITKAYITDTEQAFQKFIWNHK